MMAEPNVRQSMSSVAVANTFPALTMAAHWASASHGAYRESRRERVAVKIVEALVCRVVITTST